MMAIRASVVLVNYNNKSDLEHCLPSLIESISSADEIILVDNGSTDGSSEWLKQAYPQIHLIRSTENLGYGGGGNLGADYANGNYLAFLNPDTVVESTWLDSLVNALENDETVGAATSKILLLSDPGRINTCGNDVHISGITLCRGMNQKSSSFPEQEEVSAISGAAFIIRKDLFARMGGFDEQFYMYMEDTDLSLRARLAGYRCIYVPKSIVHHDYSLTFGPKKIFFQERNRYLMLLKSYRWLTLFALLPALFLAEVVTWGFSILYDRRHLNNKFDAYVWIIRHWKGIMQNRREVQAYRQVSDKELLRVTHHRLDYEQTSNGALQKLTHIIFDPFFYIFQKFALLFQMNH